MKNNRVIMFTGMPIVDQAYTIGLVIALAIVLPVCWIFRGLTENNWVIENLKEFSRMPASDQLWTIWLMVAFALVLPVCWVFTGTKNLFAGGAR